MESDSLYKMLMNELIQGRDVAKQLQLMLSKEDLGTNDSNGGAQELMIQKILGCFDKSITILQSDIGGINQQTQQLAVIAGTVDSPPNSFSGSPKSQDSDGDFKDPEQKDELRKSKKLIPLERRLMPGCPNSGLEQPIEDGYNWRKYGQKDILGAQHPRAYYRCTLRQIQGCLATKQVQRCDQEPTLFEVTYRGKHTCAQAPSSSNPHPNPNPSPTPNPNPNSNFVDIKLEPIEAQHYPRHHQHQHRQHSNEVIWSFQTNQPKDIKPFNTSTNNFPNSPSFSFPSCSNSRVTTHHNQASTLVFHNSNDFNNQTNFSPNTYPCSSSPMMTNFDTQDHLERELNVPTNSPTPENVNSPRQTYPEFSFNQGDFTLDYMFDNSHFFP